MSAKTVTKQINLLVTAYLGVLLYAYNWTRKLACSWSFQMAGTLTVLKKKHFMNDNCSVNVQNV